jgi:GNAT superfamily N-acetyltransferase
MEVSSGRAFYTGPSPYSIAVGLGFAGAVTPVELDRIEQFYRERGVPAKVDITPATHGSLVMQAQARGYRIAEVTSVLMRDVDEHFGGASPEIELRWARPVECQLWVDMLARHFFASEPGGERRRNMECMFHAPHALNVIATVGDQLAGVAGCMLPPDGGVAVIYGSCTLPELRGRGVHREMLRLRVDTARAAGCGVVMATALPGSDSERNLERCGFEICYVKNTWTKTW